MLEASAKECIGFRVTSAVRRDTSSSHCDSCGLEVALYPRDKLRSVRSRGTAIAKVGVNIGFAEYGAKNNKLHRFTA